MGPSRCCIRGAALAMSSVPQGICLAQKREKKAPRHARESRLLPLGRTMLDSIRTRLTLWYTGVLALVIVVLCIAAYFIFWRSAVRRTDANLVELSDSFLVTLRAELEDQTGPDIFRTAAQVAIDEHHFRDTLYVIADQTGKVILTSLETPAANGPLKIAREVLSSASFQSFLRDS